MQVIIINEWRKIDKTNVLKKIKLTMTVIAISNIKNMIYYDGW